MGFFDKIKRGLNKTSDAVSESIGDVMAAFVKVDEDLLEELEEAMILADLGASTASRAVDELRDRAKHQHINTKEELRDVLCDILSEMMQEDSALDISKKPAVILVIGVNGVGKTTTIGKLAASYTAQGMRVMLSAADTFRAAAADQLEIWAQRAGADIVRHGEGADPAAVVFDSIAAAKARNCDVIIVDTAGRLHNKKNLMNELGKINKILESEYPDAYRETLVVLDATTGQNALVQAREFSDVAKISGIVLTKMDGTAKGGIAVAIQSELSVPVKYIGVGETIDDLQKFDSDEFVNALFDTKTE